MLTRLELAAKTVGVTFWGTDVVLMRLELAAKTVGVTFWGAEVVLMTAWLKLAEKSVGVTI